MKIEVFHVACQVHIRHGHIQAVLIRQIFIRGRFDMPAQFINEMWLRFGIENLLGKEPPRYGADYTDPDGMYGGSFPFFKGQYYDTNGRRFYLGARYYFD